ncbi:MAG TPA: SET domain-containing protein-lysine N-methyltransferase [Candidatus Thermoplasmatota archaeon]|nr:SET domain-containing protein-lysine N-methyltransferase [Candidatus Thermoplasmatota archaeon]
MMRVPVKLAPSKIHGLGLHAVEPIAKGSLVWDYDAPIDQTIPVSDLPNLQPWVRKYIAIYGYREDDHIILCGDDARYFNHSKTPNCRSGHGTQTLAIRDIEVGEELTDDYEQFDDDYPLYGHLLKEGTVSDARSAAAKERRSNSAKRTT